MIRLARMSLAAVLVASIAPTHAEAKSDCALMQQLAQAHSNDMARRQSLDHSGFSDRAAKGARAENVAEGTRTRAETMAAWRASAGHAANMRQPGCKAVAFAVSRSGRHYWTMEIGQSPAELAAGKGRLRAVRGTRVQSFPRLTW